MGRTMRLIRFLLRQRQVERDLAEELELHRALTQERLEHSGLAQGEAADASRRTMGNMTLAREDARRVWMAPWLESVWQDLTYGLRTVGRSPGFALSVVTVMALGIGATTTVFSLVDGLVLRGLPVRDPDRLVYLSRPSFSYPVLTELGSRGSAIFSALSAWNLESVNIQ